MRFNVLAGLGWSTKTCSKKAAHPQSRTRLLSRRGANQLGLVHNLGQSQEIWPTVLPVSYGQFFIAGERGRICRMKFPD
jgi:hypothetical protein